MAKRQLDSAATIRRKVERRALPAEPPAHLRDGWLAVVRLAMNGAPAHEVKRARQIMRQREKACRRQNGEHQ